MISRQTQTFLKLALREDVGRGDVTSHLLIPRAIQAHAKILAKSPGIFYGEEVVQFLFRSLDPRCRIKFRIKDGKSFLAGQTLFEIRGRLRAILAVERTMLNFLARLCGIATLTASFVRLAEPQGVEILDTRKTTPLWRELEKAAVRAGGGRNHRAGLFEEVFVKENHKTAGRLEKLKKIPRRFVMEVRDFRELLQAMSLKPRVVLFDNIQPQELKRAVRLARSLDPRVQLEASGSITLENVSQYAKTGVDRISVGALTHSAPSVDLSLLVISKMG